MTQSLTASSSSAIHSFGTLLRQWRDRRGLSQLDLAITSEVSQRHISFLESGRAKPSRNMVLELAAVLEIPLRQQNLMLTAVGFAPIHTETDLSAPEMISVRKALDFMLKQQEPLPAIVVDRYWNLLLTNEGANRLLTAFINPDRLQNLFCIEGKINLMRVVFHSQGLRPFISNWEEFAPHLLERVHREANSLGESEQSTLLFNELMTYAGVSDLWQTSNRAAQNTLLLTIHLQREELNWQFFSTIATLGTPYDITLQELRIECLFPANDATEQHFV
ncbi:helix-turn-helix domain-containing protein [Merismopedia glauca]|uniref:XRE family transcriptional regulator n=1 Tax=Merismopedia glauca CCAP 1448/3 TaxID=1296344 RepID=A0A2T1C599_9CYAN|nr:helix-turn-helix transcriptional regulator [Merismopedia glauca]PSB03439.1 XRE family transcriptional regulator [Merismopedia glauca CCAP 1448/3]